MSMTDTRFTRTCEFESEYDYNVKMNTPDLLASLFDLVAMNNCNYDPAIMQAAFDTARAAIAKARGES